MNAFVEWVSQPWPWYVAGPIIGLMVPLHLILLNRTFGISSSFRHVCAACIPNNFEFLKYDWKKESWNLVFAGGHLDRVVFGRHRVRFGRTHRLERSGGGSNERDGHSGPVGTAPQSAVFLGGHCQLADVVVCPWRRFPGWFWHAIRRRMHLRSRDHGVEPLSAPLFCGRARIFHWRAHHELASLAPHSCLSASP